MDASLGQNVHVEPVAEIDGVDVVAGEHSDISFGPHTIVPSNQAVTRGVSRLGRKTYHSRSLYMMVKKTWRKRLIAFKSTASKKSQASPVILAADDEIGR